MKTPLDDPLSWGGSAPAATTPELQRAHGRARIALRPRDTRTHVADLFQQGCLKARFPRPASEGDLDAVLINTAGGLTGGDTLCVEVDLAPGALATITTPACERIYRSIGGDARVQQDLRVARGARLDWVPQETIVFDRSRLRRRIRVRLEHDARITVAESIVFGRTAMGETVRNGFLSDFWTIHRDGQLLFADALRIAEPFSSTMDGRGALRAAVAIASIVHAGADLAAKRDAIRCAWADAADARAGASVIDSLLVARVAAGSAAALRRLVVPALELLRDGRPLPRNWFC